MTDLYYIDRHWHGSLQVDIGLYGPFPDGLAAQKAADTGTLRSKGDFSLKTRRVSGVVTVAQARLLGLEYARLIVMGGQTRADTLREIDERIREHRREVNEGFLSGRALKLQQARDGLDGELPPLGNPPMTIEEYNRLVQAEWPPAGMDWTRHDV